MKEKKLLSILLFSLLICTMLAVYASAVEGVDSYLFTGDYLKYRAIDNTSDNKNLLSAANGILKISSKADGTNGYTYFRLNPTANAATEISTAEYPYMTTQFRTNHYNDLQLWPFGDYSTKMNTADGTKLMTTDGWYGVNKTGFKTSDGNWWTAKLNFNMNDMTANNQGSLTPYKTSTPDAKENSVGNWPAKSDKTIPEYYTVATINMSGANATVDGKTRYADIKYIAMHNNPDALYGSDGMDAMFELIAFIDRGVLVHPHSGVTDAATLEADLIADFIDIVETKFQGSKVTVGQEFTDFTPTATAIRHFYYQITVEYKGVKAYDAAFIQLAPEFTINNLGATIKAGDDASAALRFGFEFDMTKLSFDPAAYSIRIGAFVCPEGVELNTTGTGLKPGEVRVTPGTKYKVDGTKYSFNIVVTDIPGDENDTYESEYDTKVSVYPFVRYTHSGFGEDNYIVGEPITCSVNDIRARIATQIG